MKRKRVIVGKNPVLEALQATEWGAQEAGRIEEVWIATKGRAASVQNIIAAARTKGIPVREVEKSTLDGRAGTPANQGVLAIAAPLAVWSLEDLLSDISDAKDVPFLVVLDELKDPQNVGAILRTAEACGVQGVLIPKRRSALGATSLAKTSAGAVEYIPVVPVTNVARTIDSLKEREIWTVGSDAEAPASMYDVDLSGPVALVIGSEEKGLRRLVREKCDFLVRIPMFGHINSLNASVAAALLMYEAVRQRIVAGRAQ